MTVTGRSPLGRRARWGRLLAVPAAAVLVMATLPIGSGVARAGASPAAVTLSGQGTWDVDAEVGSWESDLYNDTGGDLTPDSATCVAFTGAPAGCVTLDYVAHDEYQSLSNLLAGAEDYAISGVPLQQSASYPPSQAPPLKASAGKTVIAVPIMPSGLAFLFDPPAGGWTVNSYDADDNDTQAFFGPREGSNVEPYATGATIPGCGTPTSTTDGCPAFEVPATDLAAMLGGKGSGGSRQWDDPSILDLWDPEGLGSYEPSSDCVVTSDVAPCDSLTPSGTTDAPEAWLRQDANDDSYYLQAWFLDPNVPATNGTTAAQVWDLPAVPAGSTTRPPINEELPTAEGFGAPGGSFEIGLDSLLGGISPLTGWFSSDGAGTNSGTTDQGGGIATTPPSGKYLVDAEEVKNYLNAIATHTTPDTSIPIPEYLYIQNDNGDWVAPTPEAIEAGVDAGAAAGQNACADTSTSGTSNLNALYATNHKVPGAYPISWVDCLYAPGQGLSMAKTDALAGLVRYLVTDGQSYLNPAGDGTLPEVYVKQALAAANTIVTDNCPGAGGQVVLTADPTVYSPISAGVSALGAVDECEARPGEPSVSKQKSAPTTSTTTTPSSPASSAVPGGFAGLGSLGAGDLASSEGSGGAGSGGGGGGAGSSGGGKAGGKGSPSKKQAGTRRAKGKAELAAAIASNLPLPLVGTLGPGLDKLSALLLGGLCFLAGRRVVRRISRIRAK